LLWSNNHQRLIAKLRRYEIISAAQITTLLNSIYCQFSG
jgi:hypothetical protein